MINFRLHFQNQLAIKSAQGMIFYRGLIADTAQGSFYVGNRQTMKKKTILEEVKRDRDRSRTVLEGYYTQNARAHDENGAWRDIKNYP